VQTAAIGYRVADFLKQHPPFNSIEEADLLELVARGRVKFHEGDEFLCWQNSAYSPYLLVIQQGAVSLWEEAAGQEILRDIRGPGDMIGIERFLGSTSYPYSAKANGDVVVYALPAADFEPLLTKYPQAERYVDAYSAAGAVYRDPSRTAVHGRYVVELARHPEPLSCRPDTSVAEAARLMQAANSPAIAVMLDEALQGVVTASDVLAWVASAAVAPAVQDIMGPIPPAVAPHALVSNCVLAMSASPSGVLALTADGTPHGGLLRLITATDLQPAFGDNPLAILEEIAHASDIEVLRILHLRARAFLLAQLVEPASVDWLAAFADRINVLVVKRLAELAGNANAAWTWCFWGAAGRGELLAPVEPEVALLCDAADVRRGREALRRMRTDLAECDFLPHAATELDEVMLCATPETWLARFTQWVRDPILSKAYTARPLFDLRAVLGDIGAWSQLKESVGVVIASEPSFEKVLVNDCWSALPPLTFFQDQVVEESGERSEVFALEQRALGPVVEVGRVFGIVHQGVFGSSTLERLELARSRTPEHAGILREACETLRVLLYLQARTGLRTHASGAEVAPGQLSRLDRQALKSAFRAIHHLLDFTVSGQWPEAR
jgi:CBS domain-containing protein